MPKLVTLRTWLETQLMDFAPALLPARRGNTDHKIGAALRRWFAPYGLTCSMRGQDFREALIPFRASSNRTHSFRDWVPPVFVGLDDDPLHQFNVG